jgi:hypothetical protein
VTGYQLDASLVHLVHMSQTLRAQESALAELDTYGQAIHNVLVKAKIAKDMADKLAEALEETHTAQDQARTYREQVEKIQHLMESVLVKVKG